MKKRLILICVLGCAVAAYTFRPTDVPAKDAGAPAKTADVSSNQVETAAEEFGIGSKAPPLDIQHWIQDGNGFFKPVETFETGKVYVVEFWATWCGPCIASMPHLAELQNKYRGQGVQVISVSDESLEEVQDLLGQENEQVGKTFGEITSAYSLTADPDRSVHVDYMEAANQRGIPTSFIVGKQGLVEWIGHPGELDEPLDAVVNDTWDRAKFQEEMKAQQEFQKTMEQISMLAGARRFDDAIKLVNERLESAETEPLRDHWLSVRNGLKISGGMVDDDVVEYYRGQLSEMKGHAEAIGRFGYSMYGASQQGADIGPLGGIVITAIQGEVEDADPELRPLLFNTMALLHNVAGNTKEAIQAQQAAIDAADDRQKRRLMPFLEELKEQAEKEGS